MKVWQRPAQPVAQQRKRKPIEEKERYRWLEGYQCACNVSSLPILEEGQQFLRVIGIFVFCVATIKFAFYENIP